MDLPHQNAKFDFAISIAVVHHMSTPERRVEAVRAVLETLRPGGRALVMAWALEQKDSRRGWDEGDAQDRMVPWVMHVPKPKKEKSKKSKDAGVVGDAPQEPPAEPVGDDDNSGDKTFHRYYHLYRKGELEHNLQLAGGTIVESGYEKDNWWSIAERSQG